MVVPHFNAARGIVDGRFSRAVLAHRRDEISAWGLWCCCYVFSVMSSRPHRTDAVRMLRPAPLGQNKSHSKGGKLLLLLTRFSLFTACFKALIIFFKFLSMREYCYPKAALLMNSFIIGLVKHVDQSVKTAGCTLFLSLFSFNSAIFRVSAV